MKKLKITKKEKIASSKRFRAEAIERSRLHPTSWMSMGLCEGVHFLRYGSGRSRNSLLITVDRRVIKRYFRPNLKERATYRHLSNYWLSTYPIDSRYDEATKENHNFRILVLLMAAELVKTL